MPVVIWRYCAAGLILLVPGWLTFEILSTLFSTLDQLLTNIVGAPLRDHSPGLGILLLGFLVLAAGAFVTHIVGDHLVRRLEEKVEQVPLVRSIYLTIKGMTDILNFRSRFGHSAVVAFPFPRDGLWALGFVMGGAPPALQVVPGATLLMVFVPTAIHPFTGYLAFVPEADVRILNLPAEEAMKMEFSAGFYAPSPTWIDAPNTGGTA